MSKKNMRESDCCKTAAVENSDCRDPLFFLSSEEARVLALKYLSPLYVYDQCSIESQAQKVLSMPAANGLTARYAMKACPTKAVLQIFDKLGFHIDASSGYEVERALSAGIDAGRIQLTAQELPLNLSEMVQAGVLFNASSLRQLDVYGGLFPGSEVSLRVNPGLGSGHSQKTNVGGPASSFGIWHEHIDQALELAKRHKLVINRLHSHIGSGADPSIWEQCANMTLRIAEQLPDVKVLNLGGGFKVARVAGEQSADLNLIGERIAAQLRRFFESSGRKLDLEIEPGTFLMANAGILLTTVIDVVDTGRDGFNFVKIDAGMTEILRPALYGAQHPLLIIPQDENARRVRADFVVVGHCCESGDLITSDPDDAEKPLARDFMTPMPGDIMLIGGCGAYCSAMAAVNYNSFPQAAEVLVDNLRKFHLIRRREALQQIIQNEIAFF